MTNSWKCLGLPINLQMSGTQEMQVDKNKHGLIIGPGGETINAIKQACGPGFSISIPERSVQSNTIKLTGSPSQINKAKQIIQTKLSQSPQNQGTERVSQVAQQGRTVTEQIAINKEFHCAIIGERGSNITTIKQKSGVMSISVPNANENSSLITITGANSSQVNKAKKLLLKFVEEHQRSTQQTDILYQKYRKDSQKYAEERNSYYQAASQAFNAGDKKKASELSKLGKRAHHKMLTSQHKAALNIFKGK